MFDGETPELPICPRLELSVIRMNPSIETVDRSELRMGTMAPVNVFVRVVDTLELVQHIDLGSNN